MTFFLGLTGGIASGKTTASNYFRTQKIPVIDADVVAHKLMERGQMNYEAIKNQFGYEILNSDLSINNQKLGQLVFSDPKKLEFLNTITHPNIFKEIQLKKNDYEIKKEPLVVLDIPLLFEENYDELCSATLLISVSYSVQIERLMRRNSYNLKQAQQRINSQMPLEQKEKRATFIINNDGSELELKNKLANLLVKIGR